MKTPLTLHRSVHRLNVYTIWAWNDRLVSPEERSFTKICLIVNYFRLAKYTLQSKYPHGYRTPRSNILRIVPVSIVSKCDSLLPTVNGNNNNCNGYSANSIYRDDNSRPSAILVGFNRHNDRTRATQVYGEFITVWTPSRRIESINKVCVFVIVLREQAVRRQRWVPQFSYRIKTALAVPRPRCILQSDKSSTRFSFSVLSEPRKPRLKPIESRPYKCHYTIIHRSRWCCTYSLFSHPLQAILLTWKRHETQKHIFGNNKISEIGKINYFHGYITTD